jgi:hypothetical protein
MYDRYKTRKRNTGIYKTIAVLAVISGVLFLGFKYQRYLSFWKYNQKGLFKEVDAARLIKDNQKKKEALISIADSMERYKEEHRLDPDAFYLSGEVHCMLGETFLAGNFSELFINDKLRDVNKNARVEFIRAIKDIKKGSALDSNIPDDGCSLMLVKACFYTDYNSPAEIFRIIQKQGDPARLKDIENIRFYSVVNILNKKEDHGLMFLSQHGMVKDNIQGLLFYATAERIAKKYTGAIVSYKNVLAMTSDEKIRKLVHINLGKIYFSKSLYKESIEQFNLAIKLDEKDAAPKIWMGKSYSAMGQKDKARAIWSEVLTTDGTNKEARELLGTM